MPHRRESIARLSQINYAIRGLESLVLFQMNGIPAYAGLPQISADTSRAGATTERCAANQRLPSALIVN